MASIRLMPQAPLGPVVLSSPANPSAQAGPRIGEQSCRGAGIYSRSVS